MIFHVTVKKDKELRTAICERNNGEKAEKYKRNNIWKMTYLH